jgi:hypothetical protein
VTIKDLERLTHSVHVTAESHYKAVALGLKAFRRGERIEGMPEGSMLVSAQNVPLEHVVNLNEFHRWLEQSGRSPAEVMKRRRIRELRSVWKSHASEVYRQRTLCNTHDEQRIITPITRFGLF